MGEMLIFSRLLQFAAVIVVFGCGAFRVYGLGGDTAVAFPGALAAFDAWFGRVTLVGARPGVTFTLYNARARAREHGLYHYDFVSPSRGRRKRQEPVLRLPCSCWLARIRGGVSGVFSCQM